MISTRILCTVCCTALTAAAPTSIIAGPAGQYAVIEHLPEASVDRWDYAIVDARTGKLYLAQQGVTALDLKSRAITPGFVHATVSHGIVSLGDGRVAVDDSKTKEVIIFDGSSGKVLAKIPTAAENPVNGNHALDALVYEPTNRLLVAVNGESGLLLLIDVSKEKVVGTISVGGHPEFAVADGSGKIFINVNRGKKTEVAVIDVGSRNVAMHFPLAGCEEATGLAYDDEEHLLMSVCAESLKVLAADTGKPLANIKVDGGADAVMWDPKRRVAFVASAQTGTLSIVAVRSASDIKVTQTLPIQKGSRLGAVDVATGAVYLPAAKLGPPKPPITFPSVVPGSFEFWVVGLK